MTDGTLNYFEQLFHQQYPIVLRQILQLVGDRTVAEDLAQEVFLRLYKQPPDDLEKVGPWLHRTLTRVSYDHIQKQVRQRRLQERMDRNKMTLQMVYPSSEQAALAEFDSNVVRQGLLQLSERDRKLLLLRHSGFSYQEIAQLLQVNENTVGTLLIRATARFRRWFEKEAGLDEQRDFM